MLLPSLHFPSPSAWALHCLLVPPLLLHDTRGYCRFGLLASLKRFRDFELPLTRITFPFVRLCDILLTGFALQMLDFGASERWPAKYCARKWDELHPGRGPQSAQSQYLRDPWEAVSPVESAISLHHSPRQNTL